MVFSLSGSVRLSVAISSDRGAGAGALCWQYVRGEAGGGAGGVRMRAGAKPVGWLWDMIPLACGHWLDGLYLALVGGGVVLLTKKKKALFPLTWLPRTTYY
jgi:hypothetical protein